MTISPEEKNRLLVSRWGAETVKQRIKTLMESGRAQSKVRAVDVLYNEAQWEPIEENISLSGFYLGTYKRGIPGQEIQESYVLTPKGVTALNPDSAQLFSQLETLQNRGILAPIQLVGVDRVKNIGTGEEKWHLRQDAALNRVNLPMPFVSDWATPLAEVVDSPKPVLVVGPISAVRDSVPSEGWTTTDTGRRRRADGVAPYPVINKDGEVNLRLNIGDTDDRVSVKINTGDELLQLLIADDTPNPSDWFHWIENHALGKHEEVMEELRAFVGRTLVVFGSGGSEIRRRDESGKTELLQLSGSFVTTTQFGFVMNWQKAEEVVRALSVGEAIAQTTPSRAVAGPAEPTAPKKPIQEAFLELVGETGASKEDVKKLLKEHSGDELVDTINKLTADGTIAYDASAKKYVKRR